MATHDSLGASLRHELWEQDLRAVAWWRRWLVLGVRVGATAARGIERHELLTRAAALTYVTVFGLVPTLAVGFAMFKAFGGLERAKAVLMPKLLGYIAVGSQGAIEARIDEFIGNVHGGAIGGVGTVFLLLSIASLLGEMEHSFNRIWEVSRPRGFFQRITIYWTMVTVTPTLVFGGVTLPATVRTLAPVEWVLAWTGTHELLFSILLPVLFVCLGFTLMYVFVPNTRVSARAALLGAVVAGALWSIAVYGYASYASRAVTYSSIYGSLGALPIFLLWIYLTWLIVLLGAEISFAAQHVPTTPVAGAERAASPLALELLALRAMAAVAERFVRGAPAPTVVELAGEVEAAPRIVAQAVAQLEDGGLLVTIGDGRLLPGKDPHRFAASDLVRALRRRGADDIWQRKDDTTRELEQLQGRAEEAAGEVWGRATLIDLARRPTMAAR